MSNIRRGVYDPGAVSNGVNEADIALQFALTLKWKLKAAGIDFWLTRDDDTDHTPVAERDDRAEFAACSHFISLHMNAGPMLANGTETFYRDVADMRFANIIHPAAVLALGLRDRGIKHESLTARKRLAIFGFSGPACLVELGFITNKGDRLRCLDRDTRIAFADAMVVELKRIGQ